MRKLASIRRIEEIKSIPDADLIVAYRVDGWWVVDKKDAYKVGDLAVYFEVDSWMPTDLAPFLTKGKEPREYKGVKGERLRTVRLKKQLSQGLLLPFTKTLADYAKDYDDAGQPFWMGPEDFFNEGDDVTETLGIQKWEPYIPAEIAGQTRGNFPAVVPKTDAERIQNLNRSIEQWKALGYTFSITEKIDGSSTTFFLDHTNDFHVCSRNWDLKDEGENVFWKMAKAYSVEQKMKDAGLLGYAIQGETYGSSMNGNLYQETEQRFIMFSVYNVNTGSYLTNAEAKALADKLDLPFVPVFAFEWNDWKSTEQMLLDAEFKSCINNKVEAEGVVYRCNQDPNITFKCISNRYLLKKGE